MSVQVDLREFLLADAGISAAVGGSRIYPLAIPQGGTVPAIVYQGVGKDRLYAHDGPLGMANAQMQLSVWANSPAAAWSLAELVIDRIDGYRGDMSGTDVGFAQVVNELDDSEEADNVTRFRVIVMVFIRHMEPA